MTNADHLPATLLQRKAVVYVRQSTQAQVQTNLESRRRQYELVDEARRLGFRNVEVIDDDLGRSACLIPCDNKLMNGFRSYPLFMARSVLREVFGSAHSKERTA